jgi:hypothetical protein
VIFSRFSIPLGNEFSREYSDSRKNLSAVSSPEDRKSSLRKTAIARLKTVPIANPSIELYNVPTIAGRIPK